MTISHWAKSLSNDDIIKVRLCYAKHKRHRVAHEVIAGPGFKLMSIARWIKVVVSLRLRCQELISADSPLLVRESKGKIVPMTGTFMARMDKDYGPKLGWGKATIQSRRRGFKTAAVRSGLHMAIITIAIVSGSDITICSPDYRRKSGNYH